MRWLPIRTPYARMRGRPLDVRAVAQGARCGAATPAPSPALSNETP